MVLGEGAAMVVLETLERAQARGADDPGRDRRLRHERRRQGPHLAGSEAAWRAPSQAALADAQARRRPTSNTSTPTAPAPPPTTSTETQALKQVFGAHAAKLAVSSTKSMVGHALGAAGALELVATLMAMREGIAPPTIGYLGPDPACDLDYVPNEARPMQIDAALSNSFAFGGLNAVLAVKRYS